MFEDNIEFNILLNNFKIKNELEKQDYIMI